MKFVSIQQIIVGFLGPTSNSNANHIEPSLPYLLEIILGDECIPMLLENALCIGVLLAKRVLVDNIFRWEQGRRDPSMLDQLMKPYQDNQCVRLKKKPASNVDSLHRTLGVHAPIEAWSATCVTFRAGAANGNINRNATAGATGTCTISRSCLVDLGAIARQPTLVSNGMLALMR